MSECHGELGVKDKERGCRTVEPYLLLICLAGEFYWQDSRLAICKCNNMRPRNVRMAAVSSLISVANVVDLELQGQQPTTNNNFPLLRSRVCGR